MLEGANTEPLQEPFQNSLHRLGVCVYTHVKRSHTSFPIFVMDCLSILIWGACIHHLRSLAGIVSPHSCQTLEYVGGDRVEEKWRIEERRDTMNGKNEKRILSNDSKQF